VALVMGDALLETLLNTPWWRGLGLLLLIGIGAFSFFSAGQLLGALRLSEFRAAFRRR
jgi:putative peptidoglycan lipid II flippase